MNLAKMLQAAGIGCGDNCRCRSLLVASLDDMQSAIMAHTLQIGAEKRAEAIQAAADEPDSDRTLLDVVMEAMGQLDDFDGEPYAGELTEDQVAVLADVPEEIRVFIESRVRMKIAADADGDPARVILRPTEDGLEVVLISATDDPAAAASSEAPAHDDATTDEEVAVA